LGNLGLVMERSVHGLSITPRPSCANGGTPGTFFQAAPQGQRRRSIGCAVGWTVSSTTLMAPERAANTAGSRSRF